MRFYSIVPIDLREPQIPDAGDFLEREGGNAASVLRRLRLDSQETERYQRICRLLGQVVPGLSKVEDRIVGQYETLIFKQDVGAEHPWSFDALSMSDGTLRVLGVLLAVYQLGQHSLIAIEEPEATVHPAVAEVIIEVLMAASHKRQIIITTHSPDILDYKHLHDTNIRVVTLAPPRKRTIITHISTSGRQALRDHLYTAGELMRVGELNPDEEEINREQKQLKLFGSPFQG